MKKVKKKNNMYVLVILLAISLLVILGSIRFLSNINSSYFARIRVAIKKKVQIVYNQNLFEGNKIDNSGIKEYDSDKQEITFDGKLEGNHINLGTLNVKLKKGERYRVTVNYLSGSYDKNGEPKFIFELQKDNEYYTDRKNGTHYIFEMLPTKKDKPIDRVLTIKDEVLDASNIIYRLYQENEVEFKNYKIQISITKLESKIGVAGEKYGKLSTPEKNGYEFLGWYDSISGGKKITETNTILKKYNHPLYAHWKRAIHPYRTVNYNNFKWTFYKEGKGPIADAYKQAVAYAIWAPDDIKDLNNVSLPLIIWLHGAGEMGYQPGGTPSNFINTGFPKVLREWSKTNLKPIPAIAIAPQTNGEWGYTDAHFETIKVGIEYALSKYNIDKSNIVLMGHSWGGRGTINISYAMQKKYSHNYFSAIVTMSPVYVDGPYPQKEQEGSYNYFSKMKIRGYSEYSQTNGFFDWLNKSDEYFYMKNINHSDIPYKSLSIDDNNDGVSDLMYWLFGEAANFK